MKRCYYEILEAQKKSTAAQITKAYRKMALKYHPDKNPSQDAKKIFLEVQQAYDVLSDPNQRTFYDNNREKILFNKDQMSKQDLQQYSFGFNIWEFFSAKCYKNFTDQEGAFFTVYRQVFENIKAEQLKAYKSRQDLQQQMRKYEGFGISTTPQQKMLSFYQDWQNFTTYKTFIWSEQYDTRDAQNRWVKRRMQEQNKKQRQKQKKNYIKTIKDLVSFVKKRDPRYQQYLIHLREQQQRKQKQKIKRNQQKKKEKEDMKKIKQQLEEQRFKEIQEYYKQNSVEQQTKNHKATHHKQQYSQQQVPQFFCPICDKTFKSQNQLDNHQKSKIHKQNVKLLQKEVMLPQEKLQEINKLGNQDEEGDNNGESKKKKKRNRKKKNGGVNNVNNQGQEQDEEEEKPKVQIKAQIKKQTKQQPPQSKNNKNINNNNKNKKIQSDNDSDSQEQVKQKNNNKNNKTNQQSNKKQQNNNNKKQQKKKKQQSQKSQSSDDQDVFMNLVQNRNTKKQQINQQQQESNKNKKNKKNNTKNIQQKPQPVANNKNKNTKKDIASQSEQQNQQQQKKLGKAKLKKMKKAEQQKDTGLKCKTCSVVFPSKTKLFDHLKQSGHAAYKN